MSLLDPNPEPFGAMFTRWLGLEGPVRDWSAASRAGGLFLEPPLELRMMLSD